MAKWRYNGKKIKEISIFTLNGLYSSVKLESGDMIQIIKGEFPFKCPQSKAKGIIRGNHNMYSVVHSEYKRKRWGIEKNILLMPLDGSDQELGMIQMSDDIYMSPMIKLFPVDSVDSW